MKTQTSWLLPRHRVIRSVLGFLLEPYIKWKYSVKIEKFKEQNGRQYLIVMNHQTGFDQFFVSLAFKGPIYYLATEDIFSLGFLSTLLRWAVAPIPIKKQTTDIQAVKNCIKVAREGGTIALAPEGNRTFNGKTVYMNPSIASLAKKLNLPVAIFRIEGGYGIQPRWSDVVRKGKMRAYVSRVIEPEEMAAMSNAELYEQIREGLRVEENCVSGNFVHKKSAEYLERAMYVCPFCGLSEFESNGEVIHCKKCGRQIRYLPTKDLEGIGYEFPYRFVAEWYDHQCNVINGLDVTQMVEEPVYSERVDLSEVIVYKKKVPLKQDIPLELYGDRIVLDGKTYSFGEVSALTILGKNKINLYADGKVYQITGSKRFNALKYVNFYHRYKNMIAGNNNGEFLGV